MFNNSSRLGVETFLDVQGRLKWLLLNQQRQPQQPPHQLQTTAGRQLLCTSTTANGDGGDEDGDNAALEETTDGHDGLRGKWKCSSCCCVCLSQSFGVSQLFVSYYCLC